MKRQYSNDNDVFIRIFALMDKFNGYNNQLDFSDLENLFIRKGVLKGFKKKEYFACQNEKTHHIGFVKSGIFRLSRIDANANEWIIGYAFEGEFLSDYPAMVHQTNSLIDIQATTNSEVYMLTAQELNNYWETSIDTQRLGRQIAEMMFEEIYKRLISFYCDTPEQRYIALMQRCPSLKENVPLKEIASFLGVTPETVSHIRKKIWQK
jgi:CRP-like cAMP-binding protein